MTWNNGLAAADSRQTILAVTVTFPPPQPHPPAAPNKQQHNSVAWECVRQVDLTWGRKTGIHVGAQRVRNSTYLGGCGFDPWLHSVGEGSGVAASCDNRSQMWLRSRMAVAVV